MTSSMFDMMVTKEAKSCVSHQSQRQGTQGTHMMMAMMIMTKKTSSKELGWVQVAREMGSCLPIDLHVM